MASALETLCGQAYGAQQYRKVGNQTYGAMFSLVLVDLAVSLVWINMGKLLIVIDQDPIIAHEAGRFTLWLIPAIFAYAIFQPLSRYLQVQSITIPMLVISVPSSDNTRRQGGDHGGELATKRERREKAGYCRSNSNTGRVHSGSEKTWLRRRTHGGRDSHAELLANYINHDVWSPWRACPLKYCHGYISFNCHRFQSYGNSSLLLFLID
ncbi:hypothetical protein OIU78_006996 [Salix suchowensis]|nr:hypothetical protein OIU78_006996 [Salix suchowensis]